MYFKAKFPFMGLFQHQSFLPKQLNEQYYTQPKTGKKQVKMQKEVKRPNQISIKAILFKSDAI